MTSCDQSIQHYTTFEKVLQSAEVFITSQKTDAFLADDEKLFRSFRVLLCGCYTYNYQGEKRYGLV